jgi:hypothetical protein
VSATRDGAQMSGTRRRQAGERAAAIAGLSMLVLAAGGCGGGDGSGAAQTTVVVRAAAVSTPATLTLRASARGRDALTLAAPRTVRAGLVRIVLKNGDTRPREAQLVRVTGSHTLAEVLAVREAEGRPEPAWFSAAGGVAGVPAGRTATSTQRLTAGTYYVIDALKDGPASDPRIPIHARLGAAAKVQVTGAARAAVLPAAKGRITARDYAYAITGLRAGPNTVRVQNTGKQPHHAIMFPLLPGRTAKEAAAYLTADEPAGPPPVDFQGQTGTTALSGGGAQVAQLNLRAGRYAVVCFLSDRQGGPPHLIRGMVAEVTVR